MRTGNDRGRGAGGAAGERQSRDGPRVGRRAFCGLAVGSAAALAGCAGDDAVDGDEAVVTAPGLASHAQLNPYAVAGNEEHLLAFFQQLVLPVDATTGRRLTSDHRWTVAGTEHAVPTAVAGFEVDPPRAVTLRFDDRLTYWNGDPLDARAYYLADRVRWLATYGGLEEGDQPGDLVSATEYRRDRSEVIGDNAVEARSAVHPGRPPLPPSFTEPWIRRLEDAATRDAVDARFDELAAEVVDFETLASEGYGSGAYEIREPSAVSNRSIVAHRRDDHPAPPSVERVRVNLFPSTLSQSEAASDGEVDLGTGVVADGGGDVDRGSLPDRLEQLATFPSPRQAGYQLVFNWADEQFRRLWVRRAIVTAIPFDEVIANGFGARARPPDHHTGMLSHADEASLGEGYPDQFHDYRDGVDRELVADLLGEAGYRKVSGQWQGPDGDLLEPSLVVPREGSLAVVAETIERALDEVGIQTETRTVQLSTYRARVADGQFGLTIGRSPGGWTAVDCYRARASVGRTGYYGSPVALPGNPLGTCAREGPPATPPTEVTVPTEPGALRIPGADYGDGSTYRFPDGVGEDVDVCAAVRRLGDPDASEEEIRRAARTCARWYNYALPTFVFAQTRAGVWGDRANYGLPAEDHPAYRAAPHHSDRYDAYLIQAGLVG